MGHRPASFICFQQFLRKIVDFSGNWTRIAVVECWHADHLNTITAHYLETFLTICASNGGNNTEIYIGRLRLGSENTGKHNNIFNRMAVKWIAKISMTWFHRKLLALLMIFVGQNFLSICHPRCFWVQNCYRGALYIVVGYTTEDRAK